jgi:type II secretory pathway component PulK
MHKIQQPRRGAALIITLVLLAVLATIASTVLIQILRDRQELRQDLLRQQADRLIDDAIRNAEVRREADSEFSGETVTLAPDQHPFGGTFRVTTQYENDRFVAEVEHEIGNQRLYRRSSSGNGGAVAGSLKP